MLKKVKSINYKALLLVFGMIVTLIKPVPIAAASATVPEFSTDKTYAIVLKSTNKAVQVRDVSWQEAGAVHVDGIVSDGKTNSKSGFEIKKDNDGKYFFNSVANSVQLKCEGVLGEGISFVFNLEKDSNNHKFSIEATDEGLKLKSNAGAYLGVDSDDMLIKVSDDKAALFDIQEVIVADDSVTIENVDTKKLVTFKDQTELEAIKVTGEKNNVTNDEKFTTVYTSNDNHVIEDMKDKTIDTVGFKSKSHPNMVIISAYWNDGADSQIVAKASNPGGWESVVVSPNGDGTVSLRSSYTYQYITVNDKNELELCDKKTEELTDREKYIIHTDAPAELSLATDFKVRDKGETATSIDLSWTNPTKCIYTGLELLQANQEGRFEKIADVSNRSSYKVEGLNSSTTYQFKLRTVNANGETESVRFLSKDTEAISATTLSGVRPGIPTNVNCQSRDDGKIDITWKKSENATNYVIQRAESLYSQYEEVAKVDGDATTYTYEYTNGKYENYFRVVADNNRVQSKESNTTSLETQLFGKNVLIFSEKDDIAMVNKLIRDIYNEQSDFKANAQFNQKRYAIYFKPGDYTGLNTIPVGFYTQVAGLGETPNDVSVNNITVPAYLDDNNATCNFWRSIENLAVKKVDPVEGDDVFGAYGNGDSPDKGRDRYLNWSVAQAAPMRRIDSERAVAYDWNFGWASGGYNADSNISGFVDDNGTAISAGTFSGQQFYTRNTNIAKNVYGCTLNHFFQGVKGGNLPTDDPLLGGNGYSNWKKPNDKGEQQIVTNIATTPIIREKPFLFMQNGEYKVFVPSIRKDATGTSWSAGNMGEGKVVSLDEFYIAKEGDTAEKINEQLDNQKNVFFTPGIYHAEETINVNKKDTVVLGTGMASIVPENKDAAMKVADEDGITIAGLIFDAGTYNSEYMLQVGTSSASKDHSANPTLLADLFFRIGGTTNEATSAKNALEINSNNVIGDHFWIWRADHGAGVSWHGNAAQNGLIVNGDNVTCYALFNEHFEDYTTLWNGENGRTYFYQNETAYDAISQDPSNEDAWLSHNGTVKGYASYKVSNNVNSHYAVGLGIYNVFIYTGGGEFGKKYYDGGVQIELDNAIEVPNKENVIVENACLQTFAKSGVEGGLYQSTNHIINGVGTGVSAGYLREETRAADGSLNGRLLDKDGNPLPTKIYTIKSKNEFDADVFKYVIREVDDKGNEIVLNGNDDEYDLDALVKKGFTYNINKDSGALEVYNNGNWINPGDFQYIIPLRDTPISKAVKGNGWARTFLASYQNGTAIYGKAPTSKSEFNKFIGLETKENVAQPMNEKGDVNVTALQNAYNEALKLKAENYSKTSWNVFNKALEIAKKQIINPYTVEGMKDDKSCIELWGKQADVQPAVDALNAAIKQLTVDKTELNNLIKTQIEDKSQYTEKSYNDYMKALEVAKGIIDKKDATQKEIDDAYKTLQTSINGLTIDKSKLEELVKTEVDKSKYTEESYLAYTKALETAKKAIDNEKATSKEINAAYNDLAQAIKELRVIDSQTEEPNKDTTPDQSGHNQSDNKKTDGTNQAKPTTKIHASKNAKTEDETPLTVYAFLGLCAISGAYVVCKRKREN
ncbi:fibronectin type III domain-containing protein [Candidatus Stoquefichus sp. SB1]|uniref:fibronectin type III domain-containing protein n=1 Tax=Candidatus Stoquefichus sp. SB1 TaxID=1658109 RepID=UPI00067E6C92|nr:fibronectin type III domain-containing protein [Candidatus Stoquefichus sp. SB1]